MTDEELLAIYAKHHPHGLLALREIRDKSAASLQSPALGGGWQDIETAPKDGERVLGYYGPSRGCFVVNFVHCSWREAGDYSQEMATPTHWMPLPPAPKQTEGEKA